VLARGCLQLLVRPAVVGDDQSGRDRRRRVDIEGHDGALLALRHHIGDSVDRAARHVPPANTPQTHAMIANSPRT